MSADHFPCGAALALCDSASSRGTASTREQAAGGNEATMMATAAGDEAATPAAPAAAAESAAPLDTRPREAIVRLLLRGQLSQASMQCITRAIPLIALPPVTSGFTQPDAAAGAGGAASPFALTQPLSHAAAGPSSAAAAVTPESVIKAAAAATAAMEDASAPVPTMQPAVSASSSAAAPAAAASSPSAASSSSSSATSPTSPTPANHKDEKKQQFITHLLKQQPFCSLGDESYREHELRSYLASLPHPQLYALSFHFGCFGAYTLTEKKDDRGRAVITAERCFFSRADSGNKGQGLRPCTFITSTLYAELTSASPRIDCGVKIAQSELDKPIAGVLQQLCGRYLAPCTLLADSHVVFKKVASQPASAAVEFLQGQLTARGVAINTDAKRWSLLHLLKRWTELAADKPAIEVKTLCALLVKEQVHVPTEPKAEARGQFAVMRTASTLLYLAIGSHSVCCAFSSLWLVSAFVSQLLWTNMLAEFADMMHFEQGLMQRDVAIKHLPFLAEQRRQLQIPMLAQTLSVRAGSGAASAVAASSSSSIAAPASVSAGIHVAEVAPVGSVYQATIVLDRPPNVNDAGDLCNQPQPLPLTRMRSDASESMMSQQHHGSGMLLMSPSPPAAAAAAAASAASSSPAADLFHLDDMHDDAPAALLSPPGANLNADLDADADADPALQQLLFNSSYFSSHQ